METYVVTASKLSASHQKMWIGLGLG
jgi:hypothetical protein